MSKAKTLIKQYEQDDKYRTSVLVSIFGKPPGLKDVHLEHNAKVVISWNLLEERREWGIKGISPMITDQEIELVFIESTEDEDIEHSFTWHIKDADISFESSDSLASSLQILPTTLEIDFNNKKSTVIFQIS